MNAKTLIAGLLTTFAAAGAFASEFNGEAFYQHPQAGVSSVSRAEVKADLARAIASGDLIQGDAGYKFSEGMSTRSRAEVRAEVLKAAAEGNLLRSDG